MARDGRSFKKVTEKSTNTVIDIRTDGDVFWAHINNMKLTGKTVKEVEDKAFEQARLASNDVWTPIIVITQNERGFSSIKEPKIRFERKFLVREQRADRSFKIAAWDNGKPETNRSNAISISVLNTAAVFPLPFYDEKERGWHSPELYIEYSEAVWTRLKGILDALLWLSEITNKALANSDAEEYLRIFEEYLEKALWAKPVTDEVEDDE